MPNLFVAKVNKIFTVGKGSLFEKTAVFIVLQNSAEPNMNRGIKSTTRFYHGNYEGLLLTTPSIFLHSGLGHTTSHTSGSSRVGPPGITSTTFASRASIFSYTFQLQYGQKAFHLLSFIFIPPSTGIIPSSNKYSESPIGRELSTVNANMEYWNDF